MLVKELIERLSGLDPEALVLTSDCCYGPSEAMVANRDAVIVRDSRIHSVEYEIDYWDGTWDMEGGVIREAVIIE